MTIRKKAMTNSMKEKVIRDFLAQMGVRVPSGASGAFVSVWNSIVTSMYSVMDVKMVDQDELGQMLNLWLSGMNPSAWWTQTSGRGGDGADKAQQFLGAFTDRASSTWNDLWNGDKDSDSEQIKAIVSAFNGMKTTLKQRAKDELRAEVRRTRDNVSIGGGGESEQDQAYESQMEGEISRSVSVGQTFDLSSWDEISAAGRKDEKVGVAVDKIETLFANNNNAMARAVVDLAFKGLRNADPFELKLFQIVMGVGDFQTNVSTQFGDISINQSVMLARPPKIKRKDWRPAFSKYMIVTAFPELRNLLVLPQDKEMPEDLKEIAKMSGVTRPLSDAIITLPTELMLSKADIMGNDDAKKVVGKFVTRNNPLLKRQGNIYAMTADDFKTAFDSAGQQLGQKWEKGKRGRKPAVWRGAMRYILREVKIDPDVAITDWIVADSVPSTASAATKKFVDDFQSDLLRILIELEEAHGWYELRNKRFAKKKEAKLHRLASKIAYRWIQAKVKKKSLDT